LEVGECKRGDIFTVNLDPVIGSEQGSRRPVVIIQNDVGNKYSPTTIVAPITSQISTKVYPTEVRLLAGTGGLKKESSILLNQIKTIDKRRLEKYIGCLDENIMQSVDVSIKISLGLVPIF
jgi:mRNA interferase MazF